MGFRVLLAIVCFALLTAFLGGVGLSLMTGGGQ